MDSLKWNVHTYLILSIILIIILIANRNRLKRAFSKKRETFDVGNSLITSNNPKYVSTVVNSVLGKPVIWIYFENIKNTIHWESFWNRRNIDSVEQYILLNIYTIYHHCKDNFTINLVNEHNLHEFVPEIGIKLGENSKIEYSKRIHLISMYLLNKYGGIWLTTNCIAMRNLYDLYRLTDKYDFIYSGEQGKPNCDIMVSKPNNKLINLTLMDIRKQIKNTNYDNFYITNEKYILWKKLKIVCGTNTYNHLALDHNITGTRDINNTPITIDNLLSQNSTRFKDNADVYLIIMNTNDFGRRVNYRWFERLDIKQILNTNVWLADLYRKSLGIKTHQEDIMGNHDYITVPPVNTKQLDTLFKESNYFASLPLYKIRKQSIV
jgi:hypothetical protein